MEEQKVLVKVKLRHNPPNKEDVAYFNGLLEGLLLAEGVVLGQLVEAGLDDPAKSDLEKFRLNLALKHIRQIMDNQKKKLGK